MPAVKFSRALYDFEAFLDVEKNLSPRTRRAYVYDLERFADHWIRRNKRNPTLDHIGPEDIKRYLEHLRMDRNYKSTTLSRTIASIRVFFGFCVMQGAIEASPAAHIHNPKTPRKLPVFLVESELKSLLRAPAADEREKQEASREDYRNLPARDYALLVVLAFTGVRLTELIGLNLGDVDFERMNIRVLGKGSKERIIPLNETVIQALRSWLEVRTSPPDVESVFVNRYGKVFSARGIEKLVERYVRKSGISKGGISPHKLRHTFATLLHVSGVDIVEIQALLGHSSITSTQVYTHTSSVKLKSAVKKLDEISWGQRAAEER